MRKTRTLTFINLVLPFVLLAPAAADDYSQPPPPPAPPLATSFSTTGSTYLVDTDNENNAGTGTPDGDMGAASTGCLFKYDPLHPIEFNFFVTGPLPTTSAVLLLETWDVDFAQGELDEVFFNNVSLGYATGADSQWSNSSFTLPLSLVVAGNNTVRMMVDQGTSGSWCTWIARGQLILDGGAPATASCRSITTNKPNYQWGETVTVTVEADTTLANQSVRIEVNLKNSAAQIITGTNRTVTITGNANDPESFSLALPISGPPAPQTWTAEALIFDSQTGAFQSTCSVTFLIGTEPIPTLGWAGLAALAVLLAALAAFVLRR